MKCDPSYLIVQISIPQNCLTWCSTDAPRTLSGHFHIAPGLQVVLAPAGALLGALDRGGAAQAAEAARDEAHQAGQVAGEEVRGDLERGLLTA